MNGLETGFVHFQTLRICFLVNGFLSLLHPYLLDTGIGLVMGT